jgi:sterol desaturase/sphingolipid hydroxylase (fatty acid hydroxylase superfamily)
VFGILRPAPEVKAMSIVTDMLYDFFYLDAWVTMIESNDYSMLRTGTGLLRAITPLMPLLFVVEIVRGLWTNTLRFAQYRTLFLVWFFNHMIGIWISLGAVLFTIGFLTPFAPFSIGIKWYGLIYGYIVWELAHFIYHYAAHKVRLLWCLHSTHHASESMNLLVSRTHFILEVPYADIVRTSVCILLGVSPPLLFPIMIIANHIWGDFIHFGENILKDGRLGWLQSWIMTPSHHRVHHARNPLYMDTNFCNLLKIWDWIFGTLQHEEKEVPPEYGTIRKVDVSSFLDIYFGEFFLLAQDVWQAPGLVNKLLYMVMPPGWSHTGDHKTASILRQSYLERHATPRNVRAAGIECYSLSASDAHLQRDITPAGEFATVTSGSARDY